MKHQKDREKINLRNEFAKEDYTKDQIEIQMSSTTKDLYFSHLFKYSAKMQNEIQIKEIKQMVNNQISILQQTTQIQEKNIILFIRLLNEEDVEISINEYLDLYKLAKFFQVKTLEKYLSKFVLNHLNDIEFIIDIINEISNSNSEDILMNVIDSAQLEQSLIGKINDCLKSEKFRTLQISQISQISRIIQKCSKESIDNNLLYEFIKQNKKERFVLFSFLSIENLNETNLKEILSKHDDNEEKKYYEYLPSNLKFIKMLKEKEDSLNEKIKNLENQMQQIVSKNKDFENQLESIKDENEKLKIQNKNHEENKEEIGNQMKQIVKKNKDFENQLESIGINQR